MSTRLLSCPVFDAEECYRVGNPGGTSRREIFGGSMRALPAFCNPADRLALMDVPDDVLR